MKKTLLIIAGSALVTGVAIKAAPAVSAVPTSAAEANVSIIRTADLDLSTPSGRRQLDQRIVIAAGEVCGEASDADLKGQNDVRKCKTDVLSAARAKANAIVAGVVGNRNIIVAAKD